jgi:hypothetical protein
MRRSYISVLLILLAIYLVVVVLYVNGRFNGTWLNDDAIILTRLSQSILNEGTLTPPQGAYQYGFAYQSLNVFLAHLSGTPLADWQEYGQPFLVLMLVPTGYIAFRSLLGASHTALLALLLLFLQPEFLFEALRSSHAKITWMLALLMLYLLARSLREAQSRGSFAASVLAFYLAAFALITSNSFFAFNYIFGIVFAFLGVQALGRIPGRFRILIPLQLRRLGWVSLSCLILAFIFIFYLYPPALGQFSTLESIIDRLAALFLDVEEATSLNPYAYVGMTWISQTAYLAVSAANWLVLALSFVMWLYQARQFLIQRRPLPPPALLLWLLYTAFAFLLAVAVIIDFAGALSANLQVRLFPHLMIAGVPLAAGLLALLFERNRIWPRKARLTVGMALPLAVMYLALAGIFKVTNEPLLSNWWAFYLPGERQAVEWIGVNVQQNNVWVGDDRRLVTLADAYGNWRPQGVRGERSRQPAASRYLFLSPIVEARAVRLQNPLPDIQGHQCIYDVGQAQLYYSRPKTPYQR